MHENNLPVFGIITIILIVSRILLNDNTQLIVVVALINLIALLVVIFSITVQTKNRINEKITESGVPLEVKEREKKKLFRRIDCSAYFTLAVVYIFYLSVLCSELGNDIISIIALGLSLSDATVANIGVKE